MTALYLLSRLIALGVCLTPSPDGRLHLTAPKGLLTPARLALLREQKQAIIDAWELWQERAAMMEVEGGLSRDAAERQAWACLGIMDSPEPTKEAAA